MLILVGVNHVSAPLDFRERLAFPEGELAGALRRLTEDGRFAESVIVSTCNRVEVLARSADGGAGHDDVHEFLERERGVSRDELQRYGYRFRGRDAVRHLFSVASGLDSMIVGEPQILGQVKAAYLAAHAAGTTGSVLEHLLQQALAVAKRVRTDTGISRHAVSIAFAAIELAKKIFDRLEGRSALVLGAGKMSELAARHLIASGVHVTVANRTYNRAAVAAERLGAEAVNWDAAFSLLPKVDIVVSGTGAPDLVLGAAQVREALRHRRGRPLFLIDIAVPRDVDPAVNDLDGAYLYDIDELQGVVQGNLDDRARAAEQARAMIEAEVAAFDGWRSAQEITPAIVALRRTLTGVGEREIERFRRKLAGMTPEQERAVEELTRALVQKILHRPIAHLKASAQRGDAGSCMAIYREIFGLPADLSEPDAASSRDDEAPPGPRRVLPGGRES